MFQKKVIATAAALLGSVLLVACDDGSDFGAGTPVINVNVDNNAQGGSGGSGGSGGTGGGDNGGNNGGGGNPDPDPDPDPGMSGIPAGAIVGSLGDGTGMVLDAEGDADPFSVSAWFNSMSASPATNNSTNLDGRLDISGFPTEGAALSGTFTRPDMWPPASADDANSLPVPDYIVSTDYIGAYEPGVPREEQWTADWTVRVNGNDAVWDFAGGEPGTALASATIPVADASCPDGTELVGTFTEIFGELEDDEAGLFGGAAASGDYDVCQLPPQFDGTAMTGGLDITLTNDNVYTTADQPGTTIGNGNRPRSEVATPVEVVVNVEAGTLIVGDLLEGIIVSRGSQINIEGSRENPVVATSRTQIESRFDGSSGTPVDTARQEWTGLVLMGDARDNRCPAGLNPPTAPSFDTCDVLAEDGSGSYGGGDDMHSIGSINYFVLRHGGGDIDGMGADLNGITLYAVGRGSSFTNIQIHRSFDDGIEPFGGNAFFKNVVLTGIGDDSFDWDNGYTGGMQSALIIQEGDKANRGFETDSRFLQVPVSFPLISNVTILAPQQYTTNQLANSEAQGILHREGTRAQVHNSIVTGNFFNGCFDLDNAGDGGTFGRASEAGGTPPEAPGPHLIYRNVIIDCTEFNFVENG